MNGSVEYIRLDDEINTEQILEQMGFYTYDTSNDTLKESLPTKNYEVFEGVHEMINTIIRSISITLDAEFNEKEYGFHMEEVKQELKEPCFFITSLNPATDLFLGKRYFRKNKFVIQYFPESKENLESECNAVAERMTTLQPQLVISSGGQK